MGSSVILESETREPSALYGMILSSFFFLLLPVVSVELEAKLVLLPDDAFPFGSAMLSPYVVMIVEEGLEMSDEIIQHDAWIIENTCKASFSSSGPQYWIPVRDFLASNSDQHIRNEKKKSLNFQRFSPKDYYTTTTAMSQEIPQVLRQRKGLSSVDEPDDLQMRERG